MKVMEGWGGYNMVNYPSGAPIACLKFPLHLTQGNVGLVPLQGPPPGLNIHNYYSRYSDITANAEILQPMQWYYSQVLRSTQWHYGQYSGITARYIVNVRPYIMQISKFWQPNAWFGQVSRVLRRSAEARNYMHIAYSDLYKGSVCQWHPHSAACSTLPQIVL